MWTCIMTSLIELRLGHSTAERRRCQRIGKLLEALTQQRCSRSVKSQRRRDAQARCRGQYRQAQPAVRTKSRPKVCSPLVLVRVHTPCFD